MTENFTEDYILDDFNDEDSEIGSLDCDEELQTMFISNWDNEDTNFEYLISI